MSVEVKLELGHRAGLRDKPTSEGFTHDWTVFVRGAEGSNIQHFVDKVVFHLHESFPKPKRVVKEPPYQVSESGYAGFIMPIEVYFRSKEEPKKVRFEYDLYLRLECSPVSNIRLEKLTFQNPSDDFRRKLLKAGGVGASAGSGTGSAASLQTQACAPAQHVEEHPLPTHPKITTGVAEKKPRSHFGNKEIAKPNPPAPKTKEPFTDIFGAPIKSKSSPDSSRSKDIGHSNQQKSKISPISSSNSSATIKEVKPSTKESHLTDTKEVKSSRLPKPEKEGKPKRPAPVDSQSTYGVPEKKKRHISISSENSEKASEPAKTKVKDGKEKNEKSKSKTSSGALKKEKEKSKSKINVSTENKDKSKTSSQIIKHVSPILSALDSDSNDSKHNCNKAHYSSPASSISETSLDGNRPFSSMMSEIDNDALSPMTSDPELSPYSAKEKHSSDYEVDACTPDYKITALKTPKVDKRQQAQKVPFKPKPPGKNNRGNGNSTSNDSHGHESPDNDEKIAQKENALDRGELMELQQKIMSSNDRQVLQKVVDVIEKTGKFQISSSSFDFDLCALDHVTVKKLKLCLMT